MESPRIELTKCEPYAGQVALVITQWPDEMERKVQAGLERGAFEMLRPDELAYQAHGAKVGVFWIEAE